MSKIYCFLNIGDGIAYAISSDGIVIKRLSLSDESEIPLEFGLTAARPGRHEIYSKYFPDGYELEFVATKDQMVHHGLQEAISLNYQRRYDWQDERDGRMQPPV